MTNEMKYEMLRLIASCATIQNTSPNAPRRLVRLVRLVRLERRRVRLVRYMVAWCA